MGIRQPKDISKSSVSAGIQTDSAGSSSPIGGPETFSWKETDPVSGSGDKLLVLGFFVASSRAKPLSNNSHIKVSALVVKQLKPAALQWRRVLGRSVPEQRSLGLEECPCVSFPSKCAAQVACDLRSSSPISREAPATSACLAFKASSSPCQNGFQEGKQSMHESP